MARSARGNQGQSSRAAAAEVRRGFSTRFLSEVIGELKRVRWPNREEAMGLTRMVIAVSATIGLFLGLIDMGFARLFDVILGN